MCYCFWGFFLVLVLVLVFLRHLFYRNPPPPFDAGLWRTPRAQRRVGSLDRRGGRAVCKAQQQFSEVPEGSRAATLLTVRRGNNISSHGIGTFSVYLSLLAPDVNQDAWFFRPRGALWHFSRTFSFLFSLFCTLPLQAPTL